MQNFMNRWLDTMFNRSRRDRRAGENQNRRDTSKIMFKQGVGRARSLGVTRAAVGGG